MERPVKRPEEMQVSANVMIKCEVPIMVKSGSKKEPIQGAPYVLATFQ